jgi:hypothetical protein
MSNPPYFPDTPAVQSAVALGIRVARRLLADPRVTPRQIVGLGHALYALQRMPVPTERVACEFGIEYRFGDADASEYKYISFSISEEVYRIFRGGSTYDKTTGGDHFSEPGWYIDVHGESNSDGDLVEVERQVSEFLALGAGISVEDESEIEWG